MEKTAQEFDIVIKKCVDLFEIKAKDYGTSWRILRLPSFTDQIYIKAQRIRSIEEKGVAKINEGIEGDFVAIVNYSVMALIQLELGVAATQEEVALSAEEALALFKTKIENAKELMLKKNHDYGEAWRQMRVSSFTDIILQKLMRTKQIEDNCGKTFVSEGVDANYMDMINYAIFALIKLEY